MKGDEFRYWGCTKATRFEACSEGNLSCKVLHGCGVYDGTEVHEASAVLVHLSRAGATVKCFAPNIDQMHTIDHTKGAPMEPNRNVLKESARIARGQISDLTELKSSDYDLIVIPGGFGAAKNLSDWAVKGGSGTINSEVERVIKDFHSNKKPIAMCCIAPVLAAKLIPGCEVTVGSADNSSGCWPYAETVGSITAVGSKHVEKLVTARNPAVGFDGSRVVVTEDLPHRHLLLLIKEVDGFIICMQYQVQYECHVDSAKKLVTAPAFMYGDEKQGWNSLHLIHDGIGAMITAVLKLC